ncbi:MAG TPA: fibro-slime domain-containing protein [Fimbriimonadaceae bacterium]|nr:fibro-slime domain-containing protein [Fimbriimonadaceae bacterium]
MKISRLAFVAVFAACAGAAFAQNTLTVTGTIRDFLYAGPGIPSGYVAHPDFEGAITGVVPNMTSSTIVPGGKPVFVGAPGYGAVSSAASFAQWWQNVPGVNMAANLNLTLTETAPGSGMYQYSSNSFFPIDNQLLGNQGLGHNFHFTFELHLTFTYQVGQTFTFTGDDDLWLYINGKRVIDLGGVHGAASQSVNLDTLGLTAGNSYAFDLFFAERHTTQSNFTITTSIQSFVSTIPGPAAVLPFALGFLASRRRIRR